MFVRDFIRRGADSFPEKIAYIDGDRSRNWLELHERTDRLASSLQKLGVKKGDCVAMMAHEHVEVLELMYACAKIGAIRVGINWRYSSREKLHIIHDSDAKVVFLQSNTIAGLAEQLADLKKEGRQLVGFLGTHELQHDYEQLVAKGGTPQHVSLQREDSFAYSYTTGTTGLPKGAIWTQGGVIESMVGMSLCMGLSYNDVYLMPAPMPGAPILFNMFGILTGMKTVLIGGDFDPVRFWELVQRHRVTQSLGVPTMIRRVLDTYKAGHYDASSIRILSYGSAPMPPALVKDVYNTLGCDLMQPYGSTEACGWVTFLRPEEHKRAMETGNYRLLESCGRASPFADVAIFREDGTRADIDEVGEVCVRADFTIKRYHNAPPENNDLYFDDWMRTGDLGCKDSMGYFYLVDRKRFMIISGGYNVYPVVVENVLSEHPAVHEIAVFGAPHPEWGEAVIAIVVLKPGIIASPTELIDFTRPHLGKWEVPKHVEIVDELPKGVTGKITKVELRQKYKSNPELLPWYEKV